MTNLLAYTTNLVDIKGEYSSTLEGIINEYNSDLVNVDFFGDVSEITEDLVIGLENKFNSRIDEIILLKNKLKEDNNLEEVEKRFVLGLLNDIGLKYIILKNSIYLEAEKGGYEISEEQRKEALRRVNKLNNIIYGPQITDIEVEKEMVLEDLYGLYTKKSNLLNEEEKEYFLNFLTSFGINLGNKPKKEKEKTFLDKIRLTPEQGKKLFDALLDLYGIKKAEENPNGFEVLLDPKRTGILVSSPKRKINLPGGENGGIYLKRLLDFFDHENDLHVLTGNSMHNTLKVAGPNSTVSEEGFAVVAENAVDTKLEDIELTPTYHHISTFFAENLDGNDTEKMLNLYLKMTKPNMSDMEREKRAKDRMLRTKRFVSIYEKGAGRKDVTYTRGAIQMLDYLKNLKTPEDVKKFIENFYYSKLGLKDLELVDDFKKIIKADDVKYPFWVGKILYKKLMGDKVFLKSLQEEDKRFYAIENLTLDTKKKIVGILNMIDDIIMTT